MAGPGLAYVSEVGPTRVPGKHVSSFLLLLPSVLIATRDSPIKWTWVQFPFSPLPLLPLCSQR